MGTAFEYDPEKSRRNKDKHGLDFEEAQQLWAIPHLIIPAKKVAGEDRFALIGRIEGRLCVAVYTRRASVIRLISCHRADDRWERIYETRIDEAEAS